MHSAASTPTAGDEAQLFHSDINQLISRPPLRVLLAANFFVLSLVGAAAAQSLQVQLSHTAESLRGVSAVSRQVAWAAGTHGTYLRTIDAGATWTPAQVPDATTLDFRAVVAFDADEAFLMSAGPGDQSRIYHTTDAGKHWQRQFTNTNPKGFFDSMVFWDRMHGIVLGDPIPDDSGNLKFELLRTDDGKAWYAIPPAQLPPALEGEGAFAASNTCIAILQSARAHIANATSTLVIPRSEATRNLLSAAARDAGTTTPPPAQAWKSGASAPDIWFATGGKAARVFHSSDRGETWQVSDTPIIRGPDSAGIFSIAFRDRMHGVIVGGDYKRPDDDGPNLAFTEDGGKTWTLSPAHPLVYFSAVAYDRKANQAAKPAPAQRLFLVGQDFIFDFRPPAKPIRISPTKDVPMKFNAASAYPEGGVVIVGPKGAIATIPKRRFR